MENLTEPQLKAIEALLSGRGRAEAAEAAGVDRVTLWRWLTTDSDFVATYNERRLDIHFANMERLRNLAGAAIDVLEDLLSSDDESIRLRTAANILKSVALGDIPEPPVDTDSDIIQAKITRREMLKHLI